MAVIQVHAPRRPCVLYKGNTSGYLEKSGKQDARDIPICCYALIPTVTIVLLSKAEYKAIKCGHLCEFNPHSLVTVRGRKMRIMANVRVKSCFHCARF